MAIHNVMRPYDYDPKHLQLPCFISPKLDGVRAFKGPNCMMFRSGKYIRGVDHIYRFIPPSMVPDGEMLIPGIPFQESAGLIRSHNQTPEAHFYIFDNLSDPLVFEKRYFNLVSTRFFSKQIHVVRHVLVHTIEDLMTTHQEYIAAGFEGSVLKTRHHVYEKKKSWEWMRMVPELSIDARVRSVYEGKGKYQGMMGGVTYEGEGASGNLGTGFDDFQRNLFWKRPEEIVGKLIRIKYKERTKDGSLRHPSFDRIRGTK